MTDFYDVAVIGSGPGGYVAAGRAAQSGFKTVLIEKEKLGGVCLNWGCIPTKALLESAHVYNLIKAASKFGLPESVSQKINWSEVIQRSRDVADRMSKGVSYLMKKRGVEVVFGEAFFRGNHDMIVSSKDGEKTIRSQNIIVATGASQKTLRNLEIDHTSIIDAKDAMILGKRPERLVVVGAGPIGMEFAEIYHSFGVEVTIVEMMNSVLPFEDEDIVKELTRSLRRKKIKLLLEHQVISVQKMKTGFLEIEVDGKKGRKFLQADKILVSIGVVPNSGNLGLEKLGIGIDESGFIKVDQDYKTNVDNIFAIGDVTGPPMLAHKASAEALTCIDVIAGRKTRKQIVPLDIPRCTYCHPQVASIGLTEKQAVERGLEILVGRSPFRANGRSISMNESDGLVKLIFEAHSRKLIGAHICHAFASELISELGVILSQGGDAYWLENTIHAHPTLSESIWEAAAAALGRSVHI